MAPEYGATCGFFRSTTLHSATSRRPTASGGQAHRGYAKKQGLWRSKKSVEPVLNRYASLTSRRRTEPWPDPKRPQDRVPQTEAASQFVAHMEKEFEPQDTGKRVKCEGVDYDLAMATW